MMIFVPEVSLELANQNLERKTGTQTSIGYSSFGIKLQKESFRYHCKICGKVYQDGSLYKKHKTRHLTECELCKRSFPTRRKFERHKLKHITKYSQKKLELRVEKLDVAGCTLNLEKQQESINKSAARSDPVKREEYVDVESFDQRNVNQTSGQQRLSSDLGKKSKASKKMTNGNKANIFGAWKYQI